MADFNSISSTCQAFKDASIPIELGPNGGGELTVNLATDGSKGACYDIGPQEGGTLTPDHPRYLNACQGILEGSVLVQEALWGDARIWNPGAVNNASAYLRRHGVQAVACGPKHSTTCGRNWLSWHNGQVGMALAGRVVDDSSDLIFSLDHEIGHGRDAARLTKQYSHLAPVINGQSSTVAEVVTTIMLLQNMFAARLPSGAQTGFKEEGEIIFFRDYPVTDEAGLVPERVIKAVALYFELLRYGEEIHDPRTHHDWPERERALLRRHPGDLSESQQQAIRLDREQMIAKYREAGVWDDFVSRYQGEIDAEMLRDVNPEHVRYFQMAIRAASVIQASWKKN